MRFENLFDLKQAFKTNILVSGANSSGKTRLSCGIVSMLHKLGYRVLAFDVSGIWKHVSDLPNYAKVYRIQNSLAYPKLEGSGIYDLSTLKLSQSKAIVEEILSELWLERAQREANEPMWLVFEEAEAYLRNIRGSTSEEVYRMVHVGRNIKARCLLITTDLALLDPSVIRLCGIRFHGFLNIEENSKRKFKSYYGKDNTRIAFEGLECGDFLRLHKRKLEPISVYEFRARHKPKLCVHFEPKPEPEEEPIFNKRLGWKDIIKSILT